MLMSAQQILNEIASHALAFSRLAGFLMVLAVVGSKNFPARFRMILALSITVLVVPLLPKNPTIELFSIAGFIQVIQQTLIGVLLGFVSRLLLETFVVGAQIIAMQSGLGFASLVDPQSGTSVPALGQFFLMLTTLLFLAFDGHLLMIRMVIESFYSLPIGSEVSIAAMSWQIILWSKWVFATAILMSLVGIASLLIVNITFGVMTRAAPQINIFVVGFPMTMVAGLIIVWATLSYFLPYFEGQMVRANTLVCSLIGLEC